MKRISFLTAFCLFVPLFADEGLWVDNLRGSDDQELFDVFKE